MNLALFATQENIHTIGPLLERIAQLQEEPVNGAMVVLHDSRIRKEALSEACLPLGRRFKVLAMLPGQLNPSNSHQSHIAALMSVFLRGAYTRFPGPWLLFDEPALPTCRNFMQEALKQHGSLGGRMTGRAILDTGSVLPLGPITIDLPIEVMKIFRYPSTIQGWRDRGRHIFARAGFQLVMPDQWIFTLREVESTQPEAGSFRGVIDMAPEEPLPHGHVHRDYRRPGPEDLPKLSNDELIGLIVDAGSPKPHHLTGRNKLLRMAEELIQAPA